ncbi:MAG: hypothetical protein JWQ81_553 [Amycolatopsis sp.]|jgi:hypothetical protein|uniref:DUF4387 domain-containing protein n=1 Tax=Amycolatopsis sp. TaxID=37632 RepID=UPI002628E62F|nr:DUF4387 domain-containing protein [Amycolatopsis sp.]MCU1679814.1 hypothetical protein [Amycolatopsis sp.]
MAETTLGELATLVRSKNAGPFWLTLDVFFATDADYARAASVVTEDAIGRLYRTDPAVVRLYLLPDIRVLKASFPRPVVQGSFADRDMHSGQQHIPLADLPISNTQEF